MDKIFNELKISSLNELYSNLGNNKYTSKQIVNIIYGDNKTKEQKILDKVIDKEVKTSTSKNDIVIEGIDNIKINVAGCCKPVPGDDIIGYISKGNGVNVHRANCPNVSALTERIIKVNWNSVITKKYDTYILVQASSKKDILLNIIAKTSNSDISIQSINTINQEDNVIYDINILTTNIEFLNKFIDAIKLIPDIISVERNIK